MPTTEYYRAEHDNYRQTGVRVKSVLCARAGGSSLRSDASRARDLGTAALFECTTKLLSRFCNLYRGMFLRICTSRIQYIERPTKKRADRRGDLTY